MTRRRWPRWCAHLLIAAQLLHAGTGYTTAVSSGPLKAPTSRLFSINGAPGGSYQLTPGVALSAQQMASLTTDIVWLEAQTVSLPDGSTTEALVPRVYLRRPVAGDLTPTGSLISASSIDLRNPGGDISNSGTLYGWGQGGVNVQANNIANTGTIAGNRVNLAAQRDITLVGGQVIGTGNNSTATLGAGGNIILQTTTQTSSQSLPGANGATQVSRTHVDRVATVAADTITLAALGNISLTGASVKATGNLGLSATGAITAHAVQESYTLNVPMGGAGGTTQGRTGHYQMASTTSVGTQISAGGNALLSAGGDASFTGSIVSAGNNLAVLATNVTVQAAKDSLSIDQQGVHKSGYERVGKADETLSGGVLTAGNDLSVIAKGDITATGAFITADKGQTSLIAQGDVTIENATTQHSTLAESYSSNKNLLRTRTKVAVSDSEVSQIERSVVEGNTILIQAGQRDANGRPVPGSGNVTIQASAVNASQGLAIVAGNDARITSAQQLASASSERQESRTPTGLGSALGITGVLIGNPVAARAGTSKTGSQAAQETSSSAIGSTLTGGEVSITSGRDTAIQGATVIADRDVIATAGRNLSITSAQDSATRSATSADKVSGFIGTVLQPAVGVVTQNAASQDQSTTQVASTIASLGANVTLKAGGAYTQTASNVSALLGDVAITGQQITVNEGRDEHSGATQSLYSKVAIGGSVNVPLIDAARSIGGMVLISEQI